jgi:hypothetical protein
MTQAQNVAIESSQINSSGVLQPAGGGTGATTTAAAYNALTPLTTTGDIVYEASASTAARLPIGTTGQVLTVAGGIPSWATASSGFSGATTNAIGSSAITLTSSSTQYQVAQINSAANSIVNLPNATTLTSKGFAPYVIENRSPIGSNLSIKDNAGTIVGYIPVGYAGLVSLKDNSTAAGTWAVEQVQPQTFFNWDATSIATNTLTGNFQTIVGLTSTLFVRIAYLASGDGTATATYTGYCQACTISGSTITYGAISSFTIASYGVTQVLTNGISFQAIRLSNTAFVLKIGTTAVDVSGTPAFYSNMNFRTCTVSGTTITYGSSSSGSFPGVSNDTTNPPYGATSAYQNGTIARLSDTSFALIYNTSVTDAYSNPYNYSGNLTAQIVTVSGTTQTVGTKVDLGTSTYTQPLSIVALSSTSLFVAYGQCASAGSTVGRTKMNVVSISGTTPTWGTSVNIEASDVANFIAFGAVNGAVAPSATQVVFNIGYGVAEGTVSGTTPTYDSTPSGVRLLPMYLTTSSKAFNPYNSDYNSFNNYLNITTGGFVRTLQGINIIPPTAGINPIAASPLGAQPTTSFVGYGQSASNTTILGNSL